MQPPTITDLIAELQKILTEDGDLPVQVLDVNFQMPTAIAGWSIQEDENTKARSLLFCDRETFLEMQK